LWRGSTPLHWAAMFGHVDIVRYELKPGPARISQQRMMGQHHCTSQCKRGTLLLFACWLNLVRILREPPRVEQLPSMWHLHAAMGNLLASWLHSRPKSLPRRFVGETCGDRQNLGHGGIWRIFQGSAGFHGWIFYPDTAERGSNINGVNCCMFRSYHDYRALQVE
jgi:ankyrin repeat protein